MMAMLGLFSVHRHGSVNAASVMLYALTSLVAGLVSATLYKRMGGLKWVTNINLTTVLFTGTLSHGILPSLFLYISRSFSLCCTQRCPILT